MRWKRRKKKKDKREKLKHIKERKERGKEREAEGKLINEEWQKWRNQVTKEE